MANVLTAGRIDSLEQRIDEAATGLVIELGHSKGTAKVLDKEDELHEVIFDAEALCEENTLTPDYRLTDIRVLKAIADRATYLVDCGLEIGDHPHG